MGRNAIILILMACLAAGCAAPSSSQKYSPLPNGLFPADGLVTQRAVLTVRGRQFALNGYTVLSKEHGSRLVVTEMFGQELADVLVQPDGQIYVMQSSRMLRAAWVRRYLAADLRCLFGTNHGTGCPVEMLSPTHFMVKRPWYSLDVHIVETKPGPQPAELFDSSKAEKP